MTKLSVVLATRNEEGNIGICLESVKDFANEIVIVDEYSTDRTCEIAKKYDARIYTESHHANFHITKQKAIDLASGDWILQLDADEIVTPELGEEIKDIINLENDDIRSLVQSKFRHKSKKVELFLRHQRLIEERDGKLGVSNGEIVAFFIPRRNYFLGMPLIHAGVYPDAVIRLIKKGKARLPAKSVHEQMEIDGEVAWLFNDLKHNDSPTLSRYLSRLNRYTDLHAEEIKSKYKSKKDFIGLINYSFVKPVVCFLNLYFRHKGFLDASPGFIWSVFSALHFPIAYFNYWHGRYNK